MLEATGAERVLRPFDVVLLQRSLWLSTALSKGTKIKTWEDLLVLLTFLTCQPQTLLLSR